ncbi:MAG: hypothetical protein K2O67_03475, partial [Clostridia bacterium]|nr:hypothetical protein [Clostridia bacterium]
MKRIIKNKFITCLIAAVLALLTAIFALPSFIASQKAYAYTTANLPTGSNHIENLVLSIDEETGKVTFNKDNLDLLAKKVGLFDVEAMIKEVEDDSIRTSAGFGDTVVNFGSYTFNGTTRELTWIPAYLSDSDDGPILTLWLANTASANGTYSNQEVSSWSNGTYSTTSTGKTWNGNKIYSNTYDGSYIRNYILNGSNNYTTGWGTGSGTTIYSASTMTKFSQFIGNGELASYIVKPNAVSWQANASRGKNDPAWNANNKGANYPSAWLNDNVWLPSIYEVFDNTIAANSTTASYSENGGLWQTGNGNSNRQKRSNIANSWLRTARYSDYNAAFSVLADGTYDYRSVVDVRAVRPALHLNLSEAVKDAVTTHVHSMTKMEAKAPGCTTVGNTQFWYCTGCEKYFADEEGETEIELESTVIPATGHSFAEGWSSNPTHHWHAATCGHDEKSDMAVHIWNDGVITKETSCYAEGETTYTCTVCSKTKTEPIAKIPHTPEDDAAIDPTCTETGKTAGSHCSVCGEVLTAQETVPATGHNYPSEWTTDGSNHWHVCANGCGVKGDNASHSFTWIVDKAANFIETGLRHEECTVCKFKRNENTEIPIQTCAHGNAVHHDKVDATCVANGTVEYKYCPDCLKNLDMSDVELENLEIPIDPDNHAWDEWVVTKEATFVEDGLKRRDCSRCDEFQTEVIPAKGVSTNELTLDLATNFEYGDEITPVISAKYGEVVLKWYDTMTGEELAEKPSALGNYKLIASVAENLDEGYYGAEKEVEFTISKRQITVTIHAGSSERGEELETLSATVTSGTIVGGDSPYELSTNADKETMGEYVITGTCIDDNYN